MGRRLTAFSEATAVSLSDTPCTPKNLFLFFHCRPEEIVYLKRLMKGGASR